MLQDKAITYKKFQKFLTKFVFSIFVCKITKLYIYIYLHNFYLIKLWLVSLAGMHSRSCVGI